VPRGEHLFDVIGPAGIKGDAFIDENDVTRIKAGNRASFFASLTEMWLLHCTVQAIDKVNLGTLNEPAVSSVYGGPIPAEQDAKMHQNVPLQAIWRVRIDACESGRTLSRELVGTATMGAGRENYAGRWIRTSVAVVQS
jgi:putative peptide zinc metalloprotease protein